MRWTQPLRARAAAAFGAAAVLGAVAALAGCTTASVDGDGTTGPAPSSTPGGSAASTRFPASTTSAPPTGASAPGGTSGPSGSDPSTAPQPRSRLTIIGASSHQTYHLTVWDSDDITDCSTHAYGEPMIRFLGAHPCRGAHRVLASVPLNGRTVAISTITTSFQGTPQDPYAATSQFIKLETADGTGSINDLLREGGTLPGAANIPSDEAFKILGQDSGVTVFDAWYLDGTTRDQDPALVTLEMNLFLTPLTSA